MADKSRVRLEPDVKKLVADSATKIGRSLPAEVNFVLRRYYADIPYILSDYAGKRKAKR